MLLRATQRRSPSVQLALAVSGLAAALVIGTAPAEAQYWWGGGDSYGYRERTKARSTARPRDRGERIPRREPSAARTRTASRSAEKAAAPAPAASPPALLTVISVASQRFTVYDASGSIMSGPVSTGKDGHRTPTGVFHILQKNKFHRSNIYSGAPMPYMQRLTWSGIALHAGALPGYRASHGCIRMTDAHARHLFAISKMGMRVVVAPSDTQAVPFTHAALPAPVMVAADKIAGMLR